MNDVIYAFFAGGTITAAVTWLEFSGRPVLSAMALLFPVSTWLSYLFIGHISGPEAVSRNALFVMLGTIFAWMPYMYVIHYLAPRIGSGRAILAGIATFLVLAFLFTMIYGKLTA